MKIECRKRKLADGTEMFDDRRGRKFYFGGAECKPPCKTVFQPEKRGPSIDVEHEEFVKCLSRSKAEGFLNETEFDARIRRGRPVTVWTKPIKPVEKKKKKFTKATGDIEVIIANITKLQKQIAPHPWAKDEENYFPYIKTEKAEENSVQNKESSVKNEEDSEESCMQKEEEAYVGSVCDDVFRSSVHTM
jgi:hypothetical protein